jgi:glycosyltransferase involved in cell wall biosynthesis
MRWPLISIVTPSYNQVAYIERTLRSVLWQRYPNLEYIVMDGGSNDGSAERIAAYWEQLTHFVSEKDDGQADAIARGFSRANGEILSYLNSDDILAPGALEFVARYFVEHPNVDAIYSHRCTVDDRDIVRWHWILPPHSNFLMQRWDLIPQETCFWRRRIFDLAGNVDPSYRFAMDYDLFVRYMQAGGRFRRVNRFLGCFRQHAAAKTSQFVDTVGQQEVGRVLGKYKLGSRMADPYIYKNFAEFVNVRSAQFARKGRRLPGAAQGVGYDYNALIWGGLLGGERPAHA